MDPGGQTATATVTTESATGVGPAGATLQGSFSGATGVIVETGFYWGLSPDALDNELYIDSAEGTEGSFSKYLNIQEEGRKYYYQAYVLEHINGTDIYEYRRGAVLSFTAPTSTTVNTGYLRNYEIPAITNLTGTGTSGTNSSRDDKWYRFYTSNTKQQVAVHFYTHPTSSFGQVRNYTVLYDGNKYAPVWTAHAMHATMWPNNGVSRDDDWISDPAISLTQQTGLNNASSVGYSRGHLVASQYRKSTDGQNLQTFYYSNQAPQWQNGFNGGVWRSLEEDLVSHAPSGRDTIYVVTGVLYEDSWYTDNNKDRTLPSGTLTVSIPSHFYMCLMRCSFNTSGEMTAAEGIAYIFTNESHTGDSYSESEFVSTISDIEDRAGFNFFPNVPPDLQTKAENFATPLW